MASVAEVAAALASVQDWLQSHESRHTQLDADLSALRGAIEGVRTGAQALESLVGRAASSSGENDATIVARILALESTADMATLNLDTRVTVI